ncbi:MAG: DUF4258 domain-containing protein [Acidobacteria bacterium]|nr:DUF4258 domain-containing protein [Acidobacteriota bacterium]MBI3656422.1 DUF4258 domain-containing protein [Acidobacteriota bacterium]
MDIENIIDAIRNNRVRITDHADEEAFNDGLTFEEIYFSVMHGEVIEDYPNDKPYPSCLILGKNFSGKPIHSVWAYNPENLWTVLITVYRPDPERWIDWKVRVKQ